MAGKKHNIGRYIPFDQRQWMGKADHINSETLCGLWFKETDRNPFAETSEDVTCKWCLRIMNKPKTH
jgi:hypothetical protein